MNNNKFIHSSIAIQPTNASLSSSQSTDESSSSATIYITNKIRLFQRMISFRNSFNNKSSIFRSYEISHDHYSIIIHFLDDTERTFCVNVSYNNNKKKKKIIILLFRIVVKVLIY
jgi:hypothetical protein